MIDFVNISLIIIILGFSTTTGQELEEKVESYPRCFQFTWLAVKPENESQFNCSHYYSVPCVKPLVITDDSTPPNVTQLQDNENATVVCPAGNICIKYSYFYNNARDNTTYFCGKMIQNDNLPIETGCYSQRVGGHVIEACACKSNIGGLPCNYSPLVQPIVGRIMSLMVLGMMLNLLLYI